MKEDDSIEIGRYLREEMTEKEIEEFEGKMHSDSKLAEAVELESDIMQAISDRGVRDLEKSLHKIHTNASLSHNRTIYNRRTSNIYKVAAAVAILLISTLSIYLLNESSQETANGLYTKYYSPYIYESVRTNNKKLNPAYEFYANEEYTRAIKEFEKDINTSPNYIRHRFLLGMCYLNTDDFDRSIESFQMVIDHQNNIYIADAKWYMALALLKNQDLDAASRMLVQLQGIRSEYKSMANSILKDIREIEQ